MAKTTASEAIVSESIGGTTIPSLKAGEVTVMVCIPAYNEEVAIGSIVLRSRRYADRVVVIDDCSTDGTVEIASLAGAEVVSHQTHMGYGGGVRSAFQVAKQDGADVLILLDGDGQHDPAEIPFLLEALEQDRADVVIGSRFKGTESRGIPFYRKCGIRLITAVTNAGMSAKVSDAQSGFRAFSKKAIEFLDVTECDMGASTEILLESDSLGLKIKEVPVSVRYDLDGSSKHPLVHGLEIVGQLLRYAETEHPITVFGIPGTVLFLIGFIQGLQVVVEYTAGGPASLGLALVSLVLMFLGALSVFTALILHALVGRDPSRGRASVVPGAEGTAQRGA